MRRQFLLCLLALLATSCTSFRMRSDVGIDDIVRSTDVAGVYRYDMNLICQLSEVRGVVKPLDRIPKPREMDLSPAQVDFIYSNILPNNCHWGDSATAYLFYDKGSYYVSSTWPSQTSFESAKPMLDHATRISGLDGKVFNRQTGTWENRGYIHKTGEEIRRLVTVGSTLKDVMKTLGIFFSGQYGDFVAGKAYLLKPDGTKEEIGPLSRTVFTRDEQGRLQDTRPDYQTSAQVHYWARDGEVVIGFQDGRLVSVSTKLSISRR
jgi:hypothetical protein